MNDHSFSWSQVWSVFTDWKTYAYGTIYISGTIALQGITLFLPTLIDGMGQWTPRTITTDDGSTVSHSIYNYTDCFS